MHFSSLLVVLATSSVVVGLPIPQGSDDDCIGSSFSPTNCNSPGANSINADPTVDVSPTIGRLDRRDILLEERDNPTGGSDDDCIGSSFSPTNCNSPGANSINSDPTLDVSPTINLKEKRQDFNPFDDGSGYGSYSGDATKYGSSNDEDVPDNDCIGSSFSPTNCNSPGANSINADPAIHVNPTIGEKREDDTTQQQDDNTQQQDNQQQQEQPQSDTQNTDDQQAGSDDDCVGSSFAPTNCNSPGANSINVKPDVDVSPTINLE